MTPENKEKLLRLKGKLLGTIGHHSACQFEQEMARALIVAIEGLTNAALVDYDDITGVAATLETILNQWEEI